ncbi:hypothetical protein MMC27_004108 [Xylographa pallens]|nr:hypothetical protein [Xylographa pallens]
MATTAKAGAKYIYVDLDWLSKKEVNGRQIKNIIITAHALAADEVVKQIDSDRAYAIKADFGSVPETENLVKKTVDKFGKIDILDPNAGVMAMKDLESPYFLAQKAAPHMTSGPHIIFLSTTLCTASTITPNDLLDDSSKGAIEQTTRVLSKDLACKGICVSAAAAGPTVTQNISRTIRPDCILEQQLLSIRQLICLILSHTDLYPR